MCRLAPLLPTEPEPRLLHSEPEAGRWRRLQALVFRWLPLESQL